MPYSYCIFLFFNSLFFIFIFADIKSLSRDIIGHIVYDFQDKEMMERFRPSLG